MKKKFGFTIIEITIVVAILGILSAVAIPRIVSFNAQARGSKIVSDMRTIDSAITIYHAKTGMLPASLDNLVTSAPNNYPPSYRLVIVDKVPNGTNFIVTKLDGKEKEYNVASGTEYKVTDGLATYGGNEKTLSWYLGGGSALDTMLGTIRDWQNGFTTTAAVGEMYMKGQYAFRDAGLTHELTSAELSTLFPGITIPSSFDGQSAANAGKLFLKSATVALPDGTMADVQMIVVNQGMGANRPEQYRSVGFIINGNVYASVDSSNTLKAVYNLPGSGFSSIAQAVQHVAMGKNTVAGLEQALITGGFRAMN